MAKNLQLDFFLNKLNDDLKLLCDDVHELPSPDKAFGTWALMLLENVTLDTALDSFVEGGGDKGIDSIYIPDDKATFKINADKKV